MSIGKQTFFIKTKEMAHYGLQLQLHLSAYTYSEPLSKVNPLFLY